MTMFLYNVSGMKRLIAVSTCICLLSIVGVRVNGQTQGDTLLRTEELLSAVKKGVVTYTLRGLSTIEQILGGLSTIEQMKITLRNRLEVKVVINIRVGTVLIPLNSDVQTVVVAEDYSFEIEAKATISQNIRIVCRDMKKLPPIATDSSWTIKYNKDQAAFIQYTTETLQSIMTQLPKQSRIAKHYVSLELLQLALWRYKGESLEEIKELNPLPWLFPDNDLEEKIHCVDLMIQGYKNMVQVKKSINKLFKPTF